MFSNRRVLRPEAVISVLPCIGSQLQSTLAPRLTAVEAGIHFGLVGTLQILFGETSGSTSALRDVFASEFYMDAAEPAAQLFM